MRVPLVLRLELLSLRLIRLLCRQLPVFEIMLLLYPLSVGLLSRAQQLLRFEVLLLDPRGDAGRRNGRWRARNVVRVDWRRYGPN